VGDVQATALTGLESATYLDKPEGMKSKTTPADGLRFTQETDRVFPANTAPTNILDTVNGRTIGIHKINSATTVVWNPWSELAAKMADIPDDAWPGFLCVETANAGSDAIVLEPGTTHAMTATISVAGL
jgi:glucose-6-phosphate 1-epimerase